MRAHLVYIFLLSVGAASHAAGIVVTPSPPAAAPIVRVAVYDYAGVPRGELQAAEREAARLYGPTHIEFVWLLCRAAPARPALCPQEVRENDLIAHLLSPAMERVTPSKRALGYAFLGTNTANILCDRVASLAAQSHFPPGVLMGMVMAHELGHLLIGAHAHSSFGIMRPQWDPFSLTALRIGPSFTGEQRQKMYTSLRPRTPARASSGRCTLVP